MEIKDYKITCIDCNDEMSVIDHYYSDCGYYLYIQYECDSCGRIELAEEFMKQIEDIVKRSK